MPVFEVQDPRGRTLQIDGDHEPSVSELEDIFTAAYPEPTLSTAVPAPGETRVQRAGPVINTLGTFPSPREEETQIAIANEPTVEELKDVAARTPTVQLGQTATIPQFGEPGTVARGFSDVLSGLGEFVLNRPEEVVASLYPPTAAAIGLRYGIPLGKQWLEDVYNGIKGDRQAAGRAAAMLAAVGGPVAVKRGIGAVKSANADVAYQAQYRALVDRMAREGLSQTVGERQTPSAQFTMEQTPGRDVLVPKARELTEDEAQRLILAPEDQRAAAEIAAAERPALLPESAEELEKFTGEENKPPAAALRETPQAEAPTTATVSQAESGGVTAPLEPSAISQATTEGQKPQASVTEPKRQVTISDLPDAEGANKTTWYHGGQKTITEPSSSFTKIESLLGSGFYLTDNPAVGKTYARGPEGQLHEVAVDVRRVANFEKPLEPDVAKALTDAIYPQFRSEIEKGIKEGKTGMQLWKTLTEIVEEESQGEMIPKSEYDEMFQTIESNLREIGVDALTHIGGLRAGKGKNLHRVLVLLDPRGELGSKAVPKSVRSINPVSKEPSPAAPAEPTPAPSARKPRKGVERPWDIIDEIGQSVGKIRRKSAAKPGTEGYYTPEFTDLAKSGASRDIFSDTGQSPDEALDTLRRSGFMGPDATVDDLRIAIEKAKANRTAIFRGETPEAKADKFQVALKNQGAKRATQIISVGDLAVGEKFKIQGEQFEVVSIDPDTGEVTVKDGRKFGAQTIPDGADVPIEQGSLKTVPKPTTFVPKVRASEKGTGELFQGEDQPFNLVGEKVEFVPPKTETTQFGEETLTQNELFAIQKVVQDVDPTKSANVAQELYGGPQKAAQVIRRQLSVLDSDPKVKKDFSKEQRARLKEVLNLLEQRATEPPAQGPGMVGMGGATSEEFTGSGTATAMKYRKIDEERIQRGLEPLTKPMGRTDQEVWDRAMAAIDADPRLPDRLIF